MTKERATTLSRKTLGATPPPAFRGLNTYMKTIRITGLNIGGNLFDEEVLLLSKATYTQFRQELENESDRGIVLMTASIIDSILQERLRAKCSDVPASSVKRLFDAGGPFHTLSSKVDWLYCTGEFSQEIRNDLNIIRELRNYCAHNWQSFAFEESVETKFIKRMKSHRLVDQLKRAVADEEGIPPTTVIGMEPRWQFISLASFLISLLNVPNISATTGQNDTTEQNP